MSVMSPLNSLDTITELTAEHVRIKDKLGVLNKINAIITGGNKKLQIVSDYDMTITKQHDIGKQYLSSFGMLQHCPSIPQKYKDDNVALTEKYRPIEINPNIPMEDKIVHMNEWWRLSEVYLKGIKLNSNELLETAKKYDPPLRDNVHEMFELLHKDDVPVLVFSAGLGDCVEVVLKMKNILLPNVKVISNYLQYDDDNVIQGYKSSVITVLNKNEHVLKGTDYYETIKNRGNIILMGDHLGDAGMAEGVPDVEALLKIGFLYGQIEENLPIFEDRFDIVLIDDQTMNVPLAILKFMHLFD